MSCKLITCINSDIYVLIVDLVIYRLDGDLGSISSMSCAKHEIELVKTESIPAVLAIVCGREYAVRCYLNQNLPVSKNLSLRWNAGEAVRELQV